MPSRSGTGIQVPGGSVPFLNGNIQRGLNKTVLVGTVSLILLFFLLLVHAAAETPSDQKAIRGEFNLSVGWVLKEKVGIVVSYWWYPVPNIIALGCSLDYLGPTLPLSLDVGLNLPIERVVPFVCAGIGGSLTRGGINFFGGGIEFRMWPKMGLIVPSYAMPFFNLHPRHDGVRLWASARL